MGSGAAAARYAGPARSAGAGGLVAAATSSSSARPWAAGPTGPAGARGAGQGARGGAGLGPGAKLAAQGPEASLAVGYTVRLRGLRERPLLNGALATCVHFDPSANRWTVRLDGGEEKAVRPEHIQVELPYAGSLVRVTGLGEASRLNGEIGTCEGFDEDTGRWTIRLADGSRKAMKLQNLVPLSDQIPRDDTDAAPTSTPFPNAPSGAAPFVNVEASPLFVALQRGSVRLARGTYFERREAEGRTWQARQEIADSDFWPPESAARLWASYRSVFFVAVSYPWLAPDHSDPESWHLRRLARFLREWRASLPALEANPRLLPGAGPGQDHDVEGDVEPLHDVGVFVDFVSLYQGRKRTEEQDMQYHAGREVVSMVYGHTHTTVVKLASVPPRVPRKYRHRGWTGFEACLSDNKNHAGEKLYAFGDGYDPHLEREATVAFLRKYRQRQAPPCGTERFAELLWRCEEEVRRLPAPHNKLFADPVDRPFVLAKYREAWEEQRGTQTLIYKSADWDNVEAQQLAALLPSFSRLEVLDLSGNRVGDSGAESLVAALAGSPLLSLDLSGNSITPEGAAAMAAAFAVLGSGGTSNSEVKSLYAFANPFCKQEAAKWRLRTAWEAAGKDSAGLVLDHFCL